MEKKMLTQLTLLEFLCALKYPQQTAEFKHTVLHVYTANMHILPVLNQNIR